MAAGFILLLRRPHERFALPTWLQVVTYRAHGFGDRRGKLAIVGAIAATAPTGATE